MSNEKEKTALDYYSKKIMKLMMYAITKSITGKQFSMLEIKLFQESKEMEKEQIKSAFNIGELMAHDYFYGNDECAENYYKETYGGNK
jgi:hypothetical protein